MREKKRNIGRGMGIFPKLWEIVVQDSDESDFSDFDEIVIEKITNGQNIDKGIFEVLRKSMESPYIKSLEARFDFSGIVTTIQGVFENLKATVSRREKENEGNKHHRDTQDHEQTL